MAELGRDLLRCGDDVFDHALFLQLLLPEFRNRNRDRRDWTAGVVEERCADAIQTFFGLLIVLRIALTPDFLELLSERFRIRDRVLRITGERLARDDAVDVRAIEMREQRLADAG